MNDANENNKTEGLLGGVVVAAVAASLCCIIPLLFAGAGVTAIVMADKFAVLRPYMLVVTGLLLLAGFYFAYRPVKLDCEPGAACGTPDSRKRARLGLWLATGFAGLLVSFPYWSGALIRSVANKAAPSEISTATIPTSKTTLRLSGMICEGCAAMIENDLLAESGVRSARVHFSESLAEIEYEPGKVSLQQLRRVIERAGYRVVDILTHSGKEG